MKERKPTIEWDHLDKTKDLVHGNIGTEKAYFSRSSSTKPCVRYIGDS
jgi:hypothetical protein